MIRSFFRLGFVAASSVVALLFLAEPSAASAATYDVDITADAPNRNQCTAAPGDCSLRGAIDKATTTPGTHTINVPNGTYTLSSVSGDLIVSKSMTIRGAGGTVIIQAATSPGVATNRVLRVASGTLTLANVEIRHGASVDGAGIHIQAGAALVGTRVLVQANQALGGGLGVNSTGGGIRTLGSLTLRRSAIVSNGARIGGGLAVESGGSASLFNTTVSNNYREWGDDASGINVRPGGSASLDGVTVYQNHALALAGQGESGIHAGGQVTIKNSIVAFNDNPLGIVNCYGNIVSLGNN
ncbi:MAG: hypothetical protein ACKVVP_14535, partial [Chloroflexota bacterium]